MSEILYKRIPEEAAAVDRMKVDENVRILKPELSRMLNENHGYNKEAVQKALDLLAVLEQKTNFTKKEIDAVNKVLQSAGVREELWFGVN